MTGIYVAGGAGVIGRALVPMLVRAGHVVTATTRSPDRARWLTSVGAHPAVVDVYDAAALARSVRHATPAVVIHQLTDLAGGFEPADLEASARLREIGTRHLVDAAVAAGARRIVAQSGAWLYADGPLPHAEADPLRDPGSHPDDVTLRGILALERIVLGARDLQAIILRYGLLYGDGAATASADETADPKVSVLAAAHATWKASEGRTVGTFNIVDDGPTVSNRRAREELGWSP